MNLSIMIREPCAFLPVVMSLAALVIVLGHVFIFGVFREADEGTAAHIFQLLLLAELPIVAFFAIMWLPRNPRHALQVGAALAALVPVFYMGT